jgi:hypothetical protein
MSGKGLPSLLERHWAESALAIGAVVIAAASLWVAVDTERANRELVASFSREMRRAPPRGLRCTRNTGAISVSITATARLSTSAGWRASGSASGAR